MDSKLKQDLDRYLTTPPEDEYDDDDFDAYYFVEYLLDIHEDYVRGKLTKEEFFEVINYELNTLKAISKEA